MNEKKNENMRFELNREGERELSYWFLLHCR